MSKKSIKDLVLRILLFYFLLITPFAIMGYMYYNYRADKHLLVAQKDQQANIQLQVSKLKELFQHVNADLLTGANQPMSYNIFSADKLKKREAQDQLGVFCSNLLKYNRIFAQASYIDLEGNEVFKVRYHYGQSSVLADKQLRNLQKKPYFKNVNSLLKDDIYVSPLDLEQETDTNDLKAQPVIHFITPVFNATGQKQGVFVLNLIGNNLIYGLKTIGDEMGWRNYMANKDGYFILDGTADYEWRFVFGQDSLLQLDKNQKELYSSLTEKKSGIIQNSNGIYCFQSINARELSNGMGNKVSHNDTWLMVSVLSNQAIRAEIGELFAVTDWLLLILSGILLITIAGYLAISTHRQKEIQLQLTRSEAQLRLANKTKDKFISILAHDLKNPLASIMGCVDLLKDGYEEMPQKSKNVFIGTLENSTHLLLRLIDDVLAWARSTTGSMHIEKEPFLVNKVLEEGIKFTSIQADKKHIKLSKKYENKVIGLADSRMIETVVRNLISNAIKFSHPNSEVLIDMYQQDALVYITVTDFGIGMDEKKAKDLFKLDQFTSTPGTQNERGTGMGLILCRDFVKRNKGDIKVKSKMGEGSQFTVSFPSYAQ